MADINNENKQELSRRAVFQVLGAAPVMVAAARPALAQMADHHAPASPKGPYQRKVFDDHQWRTVCVLCDLIIPADERSVSATHAGVPEFIDDWIAFRKEQDGEDKLEAQLLGGLMWLDRESYAKFGKLFADAAEDQQKQLLDRIAWPARAANEDHAWVEFFNRFRDLTVSGFFSSRAGVADLPYLGNRAVAEWKGCDPKVWAILEDRMKNGYKGLGGEVKPWA
jgi:gluconate 2-dehydrogenase subunit 3-like protein